MYIKRPTSVAVCVVGTALNESELTSTSPAKSSVTSASENIQGGCWNVLHNMKRAQQDQFTKQVK